MGRLRSGIADYHGAAARVGTLPTLMTNNDDGLLPPPTRPSFAITNASSSINSVFQNAKFLKSLTTPPSVTVTLPQELRSMMNVEQCQVVESVLSG
jgi:hypothetical protein